jgi:hypothetical protein
MRSCRQLSFGLEVEGCAPYSKSWMIEGGLDGYAVTAIELGCRMVLQLALL